MDGFRVDCIYRIYILILCGVICDRCLCRVTLVCIVTFVTFLFRFVFSFVTFACHIGFSFADWAKILGSLCCVVCALSLVRSNLLEESALFLMFVDE